MDTRGDYYWLAKDHCFIFTSVTWNQLQHIYNIQIGKTLQIRTLLFINWLYSLCISFFILLLLFMIMLNSTRDQIANICWIIKKSESSRKTSLSALLTMPKPLTLWITINCGKFWKRWEYQTTWPASWETYRQVRKHSSILGLP